MAFSGETVKQAWKSADSRCECRRTYHYHSYSRCNKELVWENRGKESRRGAWEAHHKTSVQSDESDSLSNCEIQCWECYAETL